MTPLRVRRAASILLAALLALSVVAPVAGGQSAAPVPDLRDPADLEAFFDAEMAAGMERANVPGAVVVVVVDGEVALLKRYGYADLATRTPVDPERTVFLAGSVAKPVTATAVMQLVEADVVTLDADVTDYVDVPIPERTTPSPCATWAPTRPASTTTTASSGSLPGTSRVLPPTRTTNSRPASAPRGSGRRTTTTA